MQVNKIAQTMTSLKRRVIALPRAGSVMQRTYFVRAGHVGYSDASDAHAELFAMIQRLPFVHDLVAG